MAGDTVHTGILDTHLLTEEAERLAKAVRLGGATVTATMTPDGLGACRGQWQLREGDGVQDRHWTTTAGCTGSPSL